MALHDGCSKHGYPFYLPEQEEVKPVKKAASDLVLNVDGKEIIVEPEPGGISPAYLAIAILLTKERDGGVDEVDAYLKNSSKDVKKKEFEAAIERMDCAISFASLVENNSDSQVKAQALRKYRSLLVDAKDSMTDERMVYATASIHRALFKIQNPSHPNNSETGVNTLRGLQAANKVTPFNKTKWFKGLMAVIFGVAAVGAGYAFMLPTFGLSAFGAGFGMFCVSKGVSLMMSSAAKKEIPNAAKAIFSNNLP